MLCLTAVPGEDPEAVRAPPSKAGDLRVAGGGAQLAAPLTASQAKEEALPLQGWVGSWGHSLQLAPHPVLLEEQCSIWGTPALYCLHPWGSPHHLRACPCVCVKGPWPSEASPGTSGVSTWAGGRGGAGRGGEGEGGEAGNTPWGQGCLNRAQRETRG